jgi:hypothetical protein
MLPTVTPDGRARRPCKPSLSGHRDVRWNLNLKPMKASNLNSPARESAGCPRHHQAALVRSESAGAESMLLTEVAVTDRTVTAVQVD